MLLILAALSGNATASVICEPVSTTEVLAFEAVLPGQQDIGNFTLRFKVTAHDEEVLIPRDAVQVVTIGNGETERRAFLLTAIDGGSDGPLGYLVQDGETRTFDWTGSYESTKSGMVAVEVTSIAAEIYPAGVLFDIDVPSDFRTQYVAMQAIAIPEPRQSAFIAVAIIGGVVGLAVAKRGKDSEWRRNLRRMNAQSRRLERQYRQRG